MAMIKAWFEEQQKATEAEFLLKYTFGGGYTIRTEAGSAVRSRVKSEGGAIMIAPGADFEIRVFGDELDKVEAFCKKQGWVCELL